MQLLTCQFRLVWQLHIAAAIYLNDLFLSIPSLFLLPTYCNCCTKLFPAPVDTRTPRVLPWKKLRHKIRFYFPSFFRFLLFSSTDSLLTDSLTLRWRQKQSDVWHYLLWDQFSVGLYLIIVWFRNVSSLISYTKICTRCHWLRTTFTVMLMVSDVRVLNDPGVAVIEFCICS